MYLQELDALQRFVWESAQLKSMRLIDAPPAVARPVLMWEAPHRRKGQEIDSYTYTMHVTQYGKLYTATLNQLNDFQEKMTVYLENGDSAAGRPPITLPLFDPQNERVGWLKQVQLEFDHSVDLDVGLQIKYRVTYSRVRPAPAPPATKVGQRMKINW